MHLKLKDFDYILPPAQIAQSPLKERSASRLLIVDENSSRLDRHFKDLPEFIRPNDLLVFNDSRVLHARLYGVKNTGGQVEVLIERLLGAHEALAQIRASKSPKSGSTLRLADAFEVVVLGRKDDFFHLRFPEDKVLTDLLEHYGALPLPPYIQRAANNADESRYQTVFARHPGSVAAPTAGLHFDENTLEQLALRGVQSAWITLHVGAGTFQPVRCEDLSAHHMHQEHYTIPQATVEAIAATKAAGGRVIAVGTTALRALESAARHTNVPGLPQAGENETDLFILPGFRFQVVDALLTNFHLPKSTLLMLVCAFVGMETIQNAYHHAIVSQYRFFSYGDAMFLTRKDHAV